MVFRPICLFLHLLFHRKYVPIVSVVEPEPELHGAETFGWRQSRNIEVSAPAPGSGSAKVF
jgi:hypothetical protein